jgi:hypothetical protein
LVVAAEVLLALENTKRPDVNVLANVEVDATQFVPSALTHVPAVVAVFGYEAVVLPQLVPSDLSSVPEVPAVAGYVAVDHAGVPTPPDRNT